MPDWRGMFDDALKAGDTPRAEIIGCRFFTLVFNKFKYFGASARPHRDSA